MNEKIRKDRALLNQVTLALTKQCFLHTKTETNALIIYLFKGIWRKVASDQCVGSKGDHYREITYTGSNTFIIAMKLVYKKGLIGCHGGAYSRWGCEDNKPTNIIVTGICMQTEQSKANLFLCYQV